MKRFIDKYATVLIMVGILTISLLMIYLPAKHMKNKSLYELHRNYALEIYAEDSGEASFEYLKNRLDEMFFSNILSDNHSLSFTSIDQGSLVFCFLTRSEITIGEKHMVMETQEDYEKYLRFFEDLQEEYKKELEFQYKWE